MSFEGDHYYVPEHRERITDDKLKRLRQALYDAKAHVTCGDLKNAHAKLIEALDITQEWT